MRAWTLTPEGMRHEEACSAAFHVEPTCFSSVSAIRRHILSFQAPRSLPHLYAEVMLTAGLAPCGFVARTPPSSMYSGHAGSLLCRIPSPPSPSSVHQSFSALVRVSSV